jgi:hypothetical protein
MSGPRSDDSPVFYDDSASDMTPVTPEGVTTSAGGRPGGLTVICVLAIILGGLGLLTGCFGLVSQAFTTQMQQAVAGMQPGNLPGAEVQKEMNARILAVANRYKWVSLPLMAVKIFVEAALLAAAVMAWGLNPRGWSWLHGALIATIIFETVHAVPQVLVQLETRAVMNEMMPKMMAAQHGRNQAPPGMENFMSSVFSAATLVSLIFILIWLVGKIVFYVIGIRYLRKPDVRALFAAPGGAG